MTQSINHHFNQDIFQTVQPLIDRQDVINLLSTCKICNNSRKLFFRKYEIKFEKLLDGIIRSTYDEKFKEILFNFLARIEIIDSLKYPSILNLMKNLYEVRNFSIRDNRYQNIILPDNIKKIVINCENSDNLPILPKKLKELILTTSNYYIKNKDTLIDKIPVNISLLTLSILCSPHYETFTDFDLSKLINLKKLYLNKCTFTNLPYGIESVKLASSHIKKEFPNSIKELELIYLKKTNKVTLPENLLKLSIEYYQGHNQDKLILGVLPQCLKSLKITENCYMNKKNTYNLKEENIDAIRKFQKKYINYNFPILFTTYKYIMRARNIKL